VAEGPSAQVAQSFNNSAPSAPVSPCCKNVKGEWAEIPKITVPDPKNNIEFLGVGDPKMTYYLGTIPKGISVPGRFRVRGHIKGTLVCKCMDDGRQLSKTQVDQPFTGEFNMPVYATNFAKKLVPGIGWVVLGYEIAEAIKKAYDVYTASPELVEELLKGAGPAAKKALDKVINSADELCKNKHKCVDPPKDDGPPIS
jgi:hypothetical protein